MAPPTALFIVTKADGSEEKVQAQAFQITADGSLCFGNVVAAPGQAPQIDLTEVFNGRVWDKLRKSSIQGTGGLEVVK